MHIPDGYLGPITFIIMYLIMIPIWLYAGYWVQKSLRTRQVPYLALAAAFSFVIMMFNVPVPGGSWGMRSVARWSRSSLAPGPQL